MTRRSKIWLVAVPYTVINGGGAVLAAAMGEPIHASIHVMLMGLGVVAWPWFSGRGKSRSEELVMPAQRNEIDGHLTHLEQTMDAVAVEVERIGEGQRFITKLFTERSTPLAPGEGAAEPIELKSQDQ